jgi:opacity protein-like surface antigen
MRPFVAFILGTLAVCGVASAQPAPAGAGYVEGVAQSAFGNVTSQSYGLEAGFKIAPNLQIFAEAGRVTNAAPASLGVNAAVIAGSLSQTQSNVGFQAKEPITFGDAGVRYLFPASGRLEPYVLVGGGIARVQKNVTFSVGGTDVTGNLQQYFIVLGTDLSGTETKPMVTFGGGAGWRFSGHLVLDLQYRYGRVFASDQGVNINRAGAGFGVRF